MDVLVLSSSYVPLRRVSWQKAFGYVVTGRAEVVHTYDRVVRSASHSWPVPSIVRFVRKAARLFRGGVKFNRRTVHARDRGRCQYCGVQVSLARFTLDHVVPRSRGGPTSWDNVVTCCVECNQRKADRTPAEAGIRLRSRPMRPRSLGIPGLQRWADGMPDDWKDYLGTPS